MGALGRRCLICQPSSRTGENPPYGMIGGTVETSASFEARYAPLSYPTAGGDQRWSSLPRQLRALRRISTDKRACIDWSGHLPGGRQSGCRLIKRFTLSVNSRREPSVHLREFGPINVKRQTCFTRKRNHLAAKR